MPLPLSTRVRWADGQLPFPFSRTVALYKGHFCPQQSSDSVWRKFCLSQLGRMLLVSSGLRLEKLPNILLCTGQPYTIKDFLAQNVNSTEIRNLIWWAFSGISGLFYIFTAMINLHMKPTWYHQAIPPVIPQRMVGAWGQHREESPKDPKKADPLDISMETFRVFSDALTAALSHHKENRLENLGTELNNLRHSLNI